MRLIKFSEAIREAQEQLLEDPKVILIGEGVGDAKNIFGSTFGLKDKFPTRVFDMPISENGGTGVCIGAAVNGLKPIMVHQRIDFSLYCMEQIVNNAAKWFSMFGGQRSVPFVIRMIIGRGFGAGNQHSQNLTSLYAHVPGLKIVCPSNAYDAKGLLISAVNDPNPVLFIEHRWLYETTSHVPEETYGVPLEVIKGTGGEDITIVSNGHAYKECLKAKEFLEKNFVGCDLIDLKTIKPLNIHPIIDSAAATGRLLVVMDEWEFCGIAAEIIAQVAIALPGVECDRLTYPNYPSGSSPGLTENYYPGPYDICLKACELMGNLSKFSLEEMLVYQKTRQHDVPDANFKGPF